MMMATILRRRAAAWTCVLGLLAGVGAGGSPAFAGPIVSYKFTAGVDAYGTNGAGYSQAVLAAPCEVRFAYDTRMNVQAGANGTRVYSPTTNQAFLQVRIGGDTYRAGPLTAVGSIAVSHASGSPTDTLSASLSPNLTNQPNLQFSVIYPTVAGQPLPMSLPSSSFQFDIAVSQVRLFRTTGQDFYDFQLGNIRPALSPFCPPDFNFSGSVSVQDLFDFLAAYFAGNPLADFNESGAISVQDIFDFLAAWFAGC